MRGAEVMMRVTNPKPTVREFIVENLLLGADTQFGDDDSLLELGALDSTAAMELVGFLEATFSLKVDNSEINPDNFETLNRIVAFIESKTALASAA
jgi:acyl carrier protein